MLVPGVADLLARGEMILARASWWIDPRRSPRRVFGSSGARDRAAGEGGEAAGCGRGLGPEAGFGGSVWALVQTAEAEAFRKRWAERYSQEFPNPTERSRFFKTRPGPSVVRL